MSTVDDLVMALADGRTMRDAALIARMSSGKAVAAAREFGWPDMVAIRAAADEIRERQVAEQAGGQSQPAAEATACPADCGGCSCHVGNSAPCHHCTDHCTGDARCTTAVHVHGCHADVDGPCDEPDEHPAPAVVEPEEPDDSGPASCVACGEPSCGRIEGRPMCATCVGYMPCDECETSGRNCPAHRTEVPREETPMPRKREPIPIEPDVDAVITARTSALAQARAALEVAEAAEPPGIPYDLDAVVDAQDRAEAERSSFVLDNLETPVVERPVVDEALVEDTARMLELLDTALDQVVVEDVVDDPLFRDQRARVECFREACDLLPELTPTLDKLAVAAWFAEGVVPEPFFGGAR